MNKFVAIGLMLFSSITLFFGMTPMIEQQKNMKKIMIYPESLNSTHLEIIKKELNATHSKNKTNSIKNTINTTVIKQTNTSFQRIQNVSHYENKTFNTTNIYTLAEPIIKEKYIKLIGVSVILSIILTYLTLWLFS
ncbi:hypothetical protein EDI_030480 [Entamoeba dispar SAW760]|uniref:Uncharacterized protein n=1 Tax=Entamoeba dispar (strain ATCC PRA-260 / SAW760) TaxID=370354 RepID=B0EI30_ENTDS|nr:uncharacterized protein EDI_030480 [Entamoeba dispar SAW760]EDR25810.1 hypothetical protein EDI_030480 [Entamoeba dispar SAW760]|eukprot:EDR25810.1 hypothetical protein EDI_030480 [Entamoeba dispar SAW760]